MQLFLHSVWNICISGKNQRKRSECRMDCLWHHGSWNNHSDGTRFQVRILSANIVNLSCCGYRGISMCIINPRISLCAFCGSRTSVNSNHSSRWVIGNHNVCLCASSTSKASLLICIPMPTKLAGCCYVRRNEHEIIGC